MLVNIIKGGITINTLYEGCTSIAVPPDTIDKLYTEKYIRYEIEGLFPNQYVCLQDLYGSSKSALARYSKGMFYLLGRTKKPWGVEPKNKEQTYAIDALMDDDIPLVTMTGKSGSGKTMLSLAVALEKVLEEGRYNKIMICRPIVPIGRDIGFLPGTKEEKLIHWLASFTDNAEALLGNKENFFIYLERGVIEVESFTYLRGRSIRNTFLIADEQQNTFPHELKTLLTRVGENSKVVLMGDVEQIDQKGLTKKDNGLVYTIEKFKPYDLAAHIHLQHGIRSPLSELASQIM